MVKEIKPKELSEMTVVEHGLYLGVYTRIPYFSIFLYHS